jgi:hypothetical protein
MSKQARSYVVLMIAAVAGGLYGWLSLSWSAPAFFAGEAVLIVLIGAVGLPWLEFAPDGAFRRHAKT